MKRHRHDQRPRYRPEDVDAARHGITLEEKRIRNNRDFQQRVTFTGPTGKIVLDYYPRTGKVRSSCYGYEGRCGSLRDAVRVAIGLVLGRIQGGRVIRR